MARDGRLAEQIRAGLENPKNTLTVVSSNTGRMSARRGPVDPLDVRSFGKPVRQHVHEFGATFGTIFLAIAAVRIYKEHLGAFTNSLIVAGIVFPLLAYRATTLMHPLWKGWMALAHKIALVMNFVILSVAWFGVLMPVSWLIRLFRIDVMDLSFKSGRASYWETRSDKLHDFQLLERQF